MTLVAEAQAINVLNACRKHGIMIVTAESCTGGLIAGALTDIAGSSDVVDRGFVTYSNDAKMGMLGVYEATLAAHGAVSEEVAREMAEGALRFSRAHIAVSITGIAGPGGGSADKPVGTVWIAWKRRGGYARAQAFQFDGDREAVRRQTVDRALAGVAELLP